MENRNNIVELIDDEGSSFAFEYIMTIDFGENEYVNDTNRPLQMITRRIMKVRLLY